MTIADPLLPAGPAAARSGAPVALALLQRWAPSAPAELRPRPADAGRPWLAALRRRWHAFWRRPSA